MSFDKAVRETLRYLFSEYLKGPSVIYRINGIAKKYHVDPMELSDYLLEKDWIRERWIYTGDIVGCKITIRGIQEINSVYVREKLRQVIGGLGDAGGAKELLEILEHRIEEYSIAMDIVRQLEQMGYIEIRHPKDSIIIQLTEAGKKYHERGSQSFYALMAY
jgi:hypothetical protein